MTLLLRVLCCSTSKRNEKLPVESLLIDVSMIARRTIVLLIACLAITAAAQEDEPLKPQPLDEELVPRGAAITRGVRSPGRTTKSLDSRLLYSSH